MKAFRESTPTTRTTVLLFCSGLILCAPQSASTQEAQSTKQINWKQLVQLVDEHPTFKQQNQLLAATHAKASSDREIPNPGIEFSVARGHSDEENATALEWGVALTIPLDWMATRNAKTNIAHAEGKEIQSTMKLLRRDILLTLRLLYWQLVYEQERVKSLDALDKQMGMLTQTIQKRIDNGDVRPIELTRVEVEKEKVAAELAMANSLRSTQSDKLAAWFGETNILFEINSTLGNPPPTLAIQNAHKQLPTHPMLRSTQAKIATTQETTRFEQRSRFPEMSLALFAEQELDKNAVGVGIEMDLPIWNFNRGAIEHSKQLEGALKTELEIQRRQLEQELIETHGQCNASSAHARRFEKQVIPKVTQVASTMERAYALGEVSLLEVIDTQRTVLETKQQLLSSQLQARLDCSKLLSFVGEDKL